MRLAARGQASGLGTAAPRHCRRFTRNPHGGRGAQSVGRAGPLSRLHWGNRAPGRFSYPCSPSEKRESMRGSALSHHPPSPEPQPGLASRVAVWPWPWAHISSQRGALLSMRQLCLRLPVSCCCRCYCKVALRAACYLVPRASRARLLVDSVASTHEKGRKRPSLSLCSLPPCAPSLLLFPFPPTTPARWRDVPLLCRRGGLDSTSSCLSVIRHCDRLHVQDAGGLLCVRVCVYTPYGVLPPEIGTELRSLVPCCGFLARHVRSLAGSSHANTPSSAFYY